VGRGHLCQIKFWLTHFRPAEVLGVRRVTGSSTPGIFFSDQRVRLNDNNVRVGLNVHFDPFIKLPVVANY
jgi:hypothetical protein